MNPNQPEQSRASQLYYSLIVGEKNKLGQWFSGTGQHRCGKSNSGCGHTSSTVGFLQSEAEWKSWLCCILDWFSDVIHTAGKSFSPINLRFKPGHSSPADYWTVLATHALTVGERFKSRIMIICIVIQSELAPFIHLKQMSSAVRIHRVVPSLTSL